MRRHLRRVKAPQFFELACQLRGDRASPKKARRLATAGGLFELSKNVRFSRLLATSADRPHSGNSRKDNSMLTIVQAAPGRRNADGWQLAGPRGPPSKSSASVLGFDDY